MRSSSVPAAAAARSGPSRSRSKRSADATCTSRQTRCRACDSEVFSDPVAGPHELQRFYDSTYYEDLEREFNPARPDIEDLVRARAAGEAAGLRKSVLPYVTSGTFFEIGAGFGGLMEGARQLRVRGQPGIEPSEQAARFGKRDVLGLDGLRHGMFDAAQWPAAFCDVIYSPCSWSSSTFPICTSSPTASSRC